MINPRRVSDIARPLGVTEADLSDIERAAAVAFMMRWVQLVLPVLSGIAGLLAGKYAYPPQHQGGYPFAIAGSAIPAIVPIRKGSWRSVSLLMIVTFVVGFAASAIYGITRPDPAPIMYGVQSK